MASSAQYITKCPSCFKYWRVTPGQFTLAAGKIRCKQCGCMFDAKRNQLQDEEQETKNSTESSPKLKFSPSQRIAAATHYHGSERPHRPSKTSRSMLVLCISLLITASLQLLYFNSNSWSKIPWLQPIYLKAAQLLHPDRPIIESLEQLSLSIEPDSQYKNLLAINFSFTNKATFEQHLPDVKLIFSDLQGRLVAQREFSAQQYLSHQSPVPSKIEPAQIITGQLSILQTASRGLNYKLQLISPADISH
ncbi:hypothetical protein A9R01_01980 ['Osedax' symbiont bacterium Rs2_46_30_T18]|mgnify:CR=1 FL=1|nr:hypothetical protein A9R01_01980 ['Osedax' symbiont bacterium Rs2_46_30_T18]